MKVSMSAGVVVERKSNDSLATGREVLFVLRKDGTYGIPAGHSNEETPRQTAIREFREETGYDVILTGVIRIITLKAVPKYPFSIGFTFRGELGKKITKGELELKWINPQQFCELLEKGKIFLPQFHIPAFWDRETAPLDIVFETLL